MSGIAPLVERRSGLVIFQTLHYRVVYHNLLVLQFDSHHPKGVVSSVVVDVDAAEALLAWLDGHPLLAGVIVDHHRGPGLANALFTHFNAVFHELLDNKEVNAMQCLSPQNHRRI